jgi:hypothetical protein
MSAQQFYDLLAMGTKGAKGPSNVLRFAVDAAGVIWVSAKGAPFVTLSTYLQPSLSPLVGGIDGRQAKYGARARLLTGLTDETLVCPVYSDLAFTGEYGVVDAGGAAHTNNVAGPGIVRMVGSATAGVSTLSYTAAGSFGCSNMAMKRWYMFAIVKIFALLPNAQTRFYLKWDTGAIGTAVAVGINGQTSTTKYGFSVATNDGTGAAPALNVPSTVSPVVGPQVAMEIWYDGDKVYGSINEEAQVTVASQGNLVSGNTVLPTLELRQVNAGQVDQIDWDAFGFWIEAG